MELIRAFETATSTPSFRCIVSNGYSRGRSSSCQDPFDNVQSMTIGCLALPNMRGCPEMVGFNVHSGMGFAKSDFLRRVREQEAAIDERVIDFKARFGEDAGLLGTLRAVLTAVESESIASTSSNSSSSSQSLSIVRSITVTWEAQARESLRNADGRTEALPWRRSCGFLIGCFSAF